MAPAQVITLTGAEQDGVNDFLEDIYNRASNAVGPIAGRVKGEAVKAYNALNDNQRAVLNGNAEFNPEKIGLPAKQAKPAVAEVAPVVAPLDAKGGSAQQKQSVASSGKYAKLPALPPSPEAPSQAGSDSSSTSLYAFAAQPSTQS